ncbi:MAG TPA: helix-turn-helix transcriptional regulator [Bdellovibrionota bacterium]|nr:helix-turn-helix transcriptional regulator [Bdellovibrionota bacterium]
MAKSAVQILRSSSDVERPPSDAALLYPIEDVPPTPAELNFGAYLRRERILRGITRNEIARVTKVRPEYVEALEGNRFAELPPRAFVVGFLRVFARHVGLNGDEVVNRFLTELAHQEAFEEGPSHGRQERWKRILKFSLTLLGVAGLLGLMFAPLLRS